MKTFQRILAVVLCLVMSLSVLGTVAFAAQTTTGEVIDTTKSGSLTIHKYEYNDNDGMTGTGSENDTVPSGAKLLDGVTFKITKVATLDSYYGTANYTLLTVEQAQAIVAANDAKDAEDPTKLYTITDTTGTTAAGVVEFKDLELGLYLVQEISAPAQITGKTPDFLVSIPMTTTDGDNWLYDVHVFPKNSSTYAGVTLQKQGRVGNENPSNLTGTTATFILEVKNDKDEWKTVCTNNKNEPLNGQEITDDNDGSILTTNTSTGKVTVSNLAPGEYRFVEQSVGNGYIADQRTTYGFIIADGSDENFPAGSVVINGEIVNTAEKPITVINEKPDVDKKIANDSTDANGKDEDNAGVGDTVKYEVTVTVPKNIADLKTFTLTDTPENLDDDYTTVKLTCDGAHIAADGVYVVKDSEDDKGFIIEFTPAAMGNYAGKDIIVTYDAVVEAGAASAGKAPNTIELTYSNKIHPDSTTPDGEGDTDKIKDSAIVYTYKINITKYKDSIADANVLNGVEFELYRDSVADANKVSVMKESNGNYRVAGAGESGTKTLTTVNGGKLVVTGLDDSVYYLVETKTEAGYNLLKEPVKLERSVYTKTTWTESSGFVNGVLVKKEYSSHTYQVDDATASTAVVSQNIVNKKGFDLPQTGGIGTLMFIIIGGVLIAGGICLITVPNKKRSV